MNPPGTAPLRPVRDTWYRELFERGLGIVCTHTPDGRITSVNPAAAAALGYERDELVGQYLVGFLAEAERRGFPHYLARVRISGNDSGTLRVETRDGRERIWAYRNAMVDDAGHPPYVLSHAQDITDIRDAVQSERRAAADHRALIDHAIYGIFRATPDGRFLLVNPALVQMLGYGSEEELMAVDIGRDVYAEPGERRRLIERYAGTDRGAEGVETRWRRKDGSFITISLSGRPVRDDAGEIQCFEMFVKDVSEQRILEAQLQQAQKMELVGQLTGGMAHDFNNILTVILANANLIAANLDLEGEAQTDMSELVAAARRGSGMVKRLLSFSRRVHFAQQPLNVSELARDLKATLARLLPSSIQVTFERDDELPSVIADGGAVEQILINLATNARDAMPDGGTLRIACRHVMWDEADRARRGWGNPGSYVCVSVTDTGIGMSEQVQRKIFEPFFTTKDPGRGTGLGMPMIYGLIKQHGGFVDVDSTPNRGTTVRVYFPATTERTPSRTTAEEPLAAGGNETILLVEDEEPIRRAAKRVLERSGYTVLVAPDGAEGLQLFLDKRQEVRLIITDVMMPHVNGSELMQAARDVDPQIKFMFMSGYAADDLERTVAMDPEIPFMQKPWTPGEFLGQVRSVLDR